MKLTYTDPNHFSGPLPKIPSSPQKQIVLLEHAVADLIDRIMYLTGGDNPGDVIDSVVADECVKISWRAVDRSAGRDSQ